MTESGSKLISWVTVAAVVTAVLAIPQAVDPWEMPSIMLDRGAAADAILLDETLGAEARDSPEAHTLRSLFLDHGRAEANPPYEVREYDRRQVQIHRATEALVEHHGPSALDALRARAVAEFALAYFDGDHVPENEHEIAMMGGFPTIAESYGLVRHGVVIAPELTVRTLYKARWNSIHRQPFVAGFSQVELQAYWGWLALHGWGKPLDKREDALVAFREAGGVGAQEAAALFDLLSGRPERAAASLQKLYAVRGELRLRNMGLGALHAALARTTAR